MDYVNERLVFAVAQQPFEHQSAETYRINTFCSLVPLLDVEAKAVQSADFYNCGLVWWMVRSNAQAFAEPGRLLTAMVEEGKQFREDDPLAMFYQVDFNSVEPVKPGVLVELLTVDDAQAATADDLVNRRGAIVVDHPLTPTVFVRWRGAVYGPFRANSAPQTDDFDAPHAVTLVPENASAVFEIEDTDFSRTYGKFLRRLSADVSFTKENPKRPGASVHRIEYEILTGAGLDLLRKGAHRQIELRSDEEVVRGLANTLLTRSQRKDFKTRLDELAALAEAQGTATPGLETIRRMAGRLEAGLRETEMLAEAVLKSGMVETKLQALMEREAAAYIDRNAATLASEIAARIEVEQQRLESLRRTADAEVASLEALKKRTVEEAEAEARRRVATVDASLRQREQELQRQTTELEGQRAIVTQQLTELAERFSRSRDEVIQQFLALTPLLQHVGMAPTFSPAANPSTQAPQVSPRAVIAAPPPLPVDDSPLDEEAFLQRVKDVAAAHGFTYERLDLISFHVAVKTNDITILGGLSGTGKSSLIDIYARALAGTTGPTTDRFLQVWVNPSWLDSKDLLGHYNALASDFQPSETRLFDFLVRAQLDYAQSGLESGVYLVLLDEMNLAQVEHYFSAFLQALPSETRTLPVFDAQNVSPTSPFAPYSTLQLSRALRFAGTVNFDETTKQLSARLLDRANLIRLKTRELAGATRTHEPEREARSVGRAVRMRDFRAWTRDGVLRGELAGVLDALRPPLEALGCPITPRRYQAIGRFVRSAAGLCSETEAFDLQVAQRVIPQVRNVFGTTARGALDQLRREVDRANLQESAAALEAIVPFLTEEL